MPRLFVIATLILAPACVGKARYEALKTDYDTLLKEQVALAQDLSSCRAQGAVPPPAATQPEGQSPRGPTKNRD